MTHIQILYLGRKHQQADLLFKLSKIVSNFNETILFLADSLIIKFYIQINTSSSTNFHVILTYNDAFLIAYAKKFLTMDIFESECRAGAD